MNGHAPQEGSDESIEAEIGRLRTELEATLAETQRLAELRSTLEAEQRAALRDAVIRTRETIREMEREHEASLRRIDEQTETAIARLRSEDARTDGGHA